MSVLMDLYTWTKQPNQQAEVADMPGIWPKQPQ
jgi:hypothetical protein